MDVDKDVKIVAPYLRRVHAGLGSCDVASDVPASLYRSRTRGEGEQRCRRTEVNWTIIMETLRTAHGQAVTQIHSAVCWTQFSHYVLNVGLCRNRRSVVVISFCYPA